jgi:hypothetical protein
VAHELLLLWRTALSVSEVLSSLLSSLDSPVPTAQARRATSLGGFQSSMESNRRQEIFDFSFEFECVCCCGLNLDGALEPPDQKSQGFMV